MYVLCSKYCTSRVVITNVVLKKGMEYICQIQWEFGFSSDMLASGRECQKVKVKKDLKNDLEIKIKTMIYVRSLVPLQITKVGLYHYCIEIL